MDIVQWLRACPCNRSKESADEIERLTNNADNLRQQVEDLTEELRVERLNHGYLREEFDELHTGAVERLRQLQATVKERDALRQNAAMAQVCLDLHDALGVRFGDDPYTAIRELRLDAERWRARVEQAFREGYWARETYNDNEVSDVNERWERAKVTLLAMPSTRR